jgi:putative NADH-flavin reductase
MRVAVIGAGGRTGRDVVEQALARGAAVTAVARDPGKLVLDDRDLRLAQADIRDVDALSNALAGADAVVSALGTGKSRSATDVYSLGAANELKAMEVNGIVRIAVISAVPAGPRGEQPFVRRRVAIPLLERLFGFYDDMRRMESLLARSDADWVALRPPRLVAKPATGSYRVGTTPLPHGRVITFADLATALLDAIDRPELYGHAVYVAN